MNSFQFFDQNHLNCNTNKQNNHCYQNIKRCNFVIGSNKIKFAVFEHGITTLEHNMVYLQKEMRILSGFTINEGNFKNLIGSSLRNEMYIKSCRVIVCLTNSFLRP